MRVTGGSVEPERKRRQIAVSFAVLAFLVIAYRLAFWPLHGLIGNSAFLFGLIPCLAAAVAFGVRGALVVILVVAAFDRGFALTMPGPETGVPAGVIALLSKLVLAGGLGLVIDSRRRIRALNRRLQTEIEDKQQSQESLRQSEELYRALVESLGEGVGLFDAQDRLVFANRALATTLQVPADGLVGMSFSELVTDGARERGALEADSAKGVTSYEVTPRSSAAALLLVTETKLDASGGRRLRVLRDLTERLALERRQREHDRELQRSQALQSLAVMAGGVAHDFNNLLCGVVGNAEVAKRKIPPGAPPVLSHCLTEILAFASEAAQLSKQMLAYAGQRSLGIEALDVNAELSGALRLLHATVESKARLVVDLADNLPEVAADRFQLRQVVTNLVLNALEAMAGQRGLLPLRTELLTLEGASAARYDLAAGDYVKIAVEDTGPGIAEHAREHLFEPFFSTKAPGRGMGLAAAAGIVRAHRGWLGVDSTSAQGTRFCALLPLARTSTPRPTSERRAASTSRAGCNVLLIDDEPAVRVVTGRLLNELGHSVTTAESGQRGLELFRKQPESVDVVVLDLTMPERSGEEVLDDLRHVRGDIPVVITSGFQATDASKLMAMSNVIGFLDKPHTLAKLEAILASVGPRVAGASAPAAASY